jgi:hypothetical protein
MPVTFAHKSELHRGDGYHGGMQHREANVESRGRRSWLGAVLAAVLLTLPILYVLSVGPVVYLQTRGVLEFKPGSAITYFYWPLQWAQIQCPPFLRLMNRYGRMWVYQPPPAPAAPPPAPAAPASSAP